MSVEGVTIVNNLKGRVHGVNSMVAISGIDDTIRGLRVLQQMVEENVIIEECHDLPDGNVGKLYRYNQFRRGLQPRSAIRAVK